MPGWGHQASVLLGLASPVDIWRPRAGRPSSSSSSSRYRGTLSWLCSSMLLAGDRGHGDPSSSTSPCWGYRGQAKGGGAVPCSPVCVPTAPAHLSVSPQPLLTFPSASALTAILPILRFMVREITARHFLPSFVPLLRVASSGLALLASSSGICQRHEE